MRAALPGVTLEQARRGVQQERQQGAVGLGDLERALQGASGGGSVAQRVHGDRLKQESLALYGPRDHRGGAVKHRRERDRGRFLVALGEPQRSGGHAHVSAVAVLVAEVGEGLLSALGLAEAHQGPKHPCPRRRDDVVRCGDVPGQPFGGLVSGQRVGVSVPRRLEQPADVIDPHCLRWLGLRSDGALRALDPGLCLFDPSLRGQRAAEHHVGGTGGRLVGPAVPFGQLDRLPAALRRRANDRLISTAAWCARPVNSR